MESYGNAVIRALTVWSSQFLRSPPSGFSEVPLWRPRGALILADEAMASSLKARVDAIRTLVPSVQFVTPVDIERLAPFLRKNRWIAGLYEPGAFDLDVHAIHSAYISGFRRRGGDIMRGTELLAAQRRANVWRLETNKGTTEAATLVNAAGAWADEIALRSGLHGCGLRPLRRTVLQIEGERQYPDAPYVGSVDEQIFIKPEANSLLVSPCDETPTAPCDAAPDEIDIAIAMDRLLSMTDIDRPRIKAKWAGLRTFAADRSPVIGPDPCEASFLWFAGLGGYGIQAGPAMAKLCVASAVDDARARDTMRHITGDRDFSADVGPDRCQSSKISDGALRPVSELR
jgi:D-arginine dehydrogenase